MTPTRDLLVIFLGVLATMLVCRCVPMFVLKGRSLPERVEKALSLIPAAAFAALVANDLIKLDLAAQGASAFLLPFAAAVPVVLVAKKTGSLIWSAVVGMAAYALLGMVV